METSSKAAEKKVILELTELLKKNSSKVLSGETKLCLTTSSVNILATNFRRFSTNADQENGKASSRKQEAEREKWKQNVKILFDFVMQVKALKIIHGNSTMRTPVQIARFRSLQVLEVKKLPIHMVEGLSLIRGKLKEITVLKSIETLQELLEICGGDRSPGLVWPHLRSIYLSFNFLKQLDMSLRFIPFVEIVDLSHNSIARTGDFLKCLSDVVKINLNYNMLTSIPSFSTSNLLKLKTLVLRSNQLDNLEGIEELIALEELDVSNNFLLDHKVLASLSALNRLQVLCVIGNPLCYKTHHRHLTVQHISPIAGLGVFLLDGARLSPDEIKILKQNQYRALQQSSAQTNDTANMETNSHSSNGELAVGVSLTPKKKGHRRQRSMERIPVISDMEESMMEENKPRSGYGTPALSSSFATDTMDLSAELENEKRRYEIMRAHYKDDWLKALTADQRRNQGHLQDSQDMSGDGWLRKDPTDLTMSTENSVPADTPVSKPERASVAEAPIVADVAVLQSSEKRPSASPAQNKHTTASANNVNHDTTDATNKPPHTLHIGDTTDIYSLQTLPKQDGQRSEPVSPIPMYSQVSVDSGKSGADADESAQYGEEGEPFIVMLPTDDMKSLIITMNNRFILEKDFNGHKLGSLDLKCILNVSRQQEKCYGTDIIGGFLFQVLTVDFDYVRKDNRQRKYALEDEYDAQVLEAMLLEHIKPKEISERVMECLKCHHEFEQAIQTESSVLTKCPKCKSKMVIEKSGVIHTSEAVKPSRPTSNTASNSGTELSSSWNTASERQSSRFQRKKQQLKRTGDSIARSETSRLSDSSVKPVTETPETGLPRNTSWSELHKASSHSLGARDSISSAESDIAVLASHSSRSDICGAIPESIHEDIPPGTTRPAQYTISSNRSSLPQMTASDGALSSMESAHGDRAVTDSNGVVWLRNNQGQTTPVGSPLTTSICSSMISSVYEKTLSGMGDEPGESPPSGVLDNQSVPDSDVVLRNSQIGDHTRNTGTSQHRNATMYGDGSLPDRSWDNHDGHTDSSTDSVTVMHSHRSESLASQLYSNTTSGVSIYETAPSTSSIYETAPSGNDSGEALSQDSRVSHTLSSAKDSPSSSTMSTPVLRRNTHQSSDSSNKRSAIYTETDQSLNSTSSDPALKESFSSDLTDFPSHLSPIKRRNARRDRAILSVDETESNAHNGSHDISANMSEQASETSLEGHKSNGNPEDDSISSGANTRGMLPWELDVQKSVNSGKDDSLNHEEFVNIDHRVQLYLELKVFDAEEVAQCAIQCDVIQYKKEGEIKSLLVISSNRILIFQITGDSTATVDWLRSYEDQPITELQYVDIGLGYQTLRLEFSKKCSSYTLLIADEGRCKQFLTLITDIVQSVAMSEHSKLESISKSNPSTLQNLSTQVIHCTENPDPEAEPQELVKYLLIKYMTDICDIGETMGFVVTTTDLILVNHNHQWPLPRLQEPLPESIKGRQFTIAHREKINNIASVMFNEFNPTELRVTFFENPEVQDANSIWLITLETVKGVKSLVEAIKDPWESEFGVSLDISAASFTE